MANEDMRNKLREFVAREGVHVRKPGDGRTARADTLVLSVGQYTNNGCQVAATAEWYSAESHDDDDFSAGGFIYLKPRHGSVRNQIRVKGATVADVLAQLTA